MAEKSWSKLARHFTILLSDKDTKIIADIQQYGEKWREIVHEYRNDLYKREDESRKNIQRVQSGIQQIRNLLSTHSL